MLKQQKLLNTTRVQNGKPSSLDSKDSEIIFSAVYLIETNKSTMPTEKIEKGLRGNSVTLDDSLQIYFEEIIEKTKKGKGSPSPIVFKNNEGSQQNDVRDQIRKIAFGDLNVKEQTTRELAVKLTHFTDERSRRNLLIVLVRKCLGDNDEVESYEVYLYQFGSDKPIQIKNQSNGQIDIEEAIDIFSQKGEHYKTAYFEGNKSKTSFWKGTIVDKQAGGKEAARYWMNNFLESKYEMTDRQGTRKLVKTLKQTLSGEESIQQKMNLIASISNLSARREEEVTFSDINNHHIQQELRESFQNNLKDPERKMYDQPFKIDRRVVVKELKHTKMTIELAGSPKEAVQLFGEPEVLQRISDRDKHDNIKINFEGKLLNVEFSK